MTNEQFFKFWNDTHAAFGYEGQEKKRLSAFKRTFERVEHVPFEALRFVQSRIEDLDSLPRNLGKAILGGWLEWKSRNPDRVVSEQSYGGSKDCLYCCDGFIYASRDKVSKVYPDAEYPFFFRCAHCGGGVGNFLAKTRDQLESEGYRITKPEFVGQYKSVEPRERQGNLLDDYAA